jgi:hypothetical protein
VFVLETRGSDAELLASKQAGRIRG